MSIVVQAVPLLFAALIVTLILRPLIARRRPAPPRPRRTRPQRSNLRVVSSDRMDDELKDLLKRG